MSAKEFGGVDLVLGSVRGFRSWKPTIEGKLEPLSQSGTWTPGENVAVCRSGGHSQVPKIEGEELKDRHVRVEAWRANHEMADCEHGFYAYFTPEGNDSHYSHEPRIAGVIEGYGEVVIGTKGFRATRARIVALAVEPHGGMWTLEQFVFDRLTNNYPGVPIMRSVLAMYAEFPAGRAESFA